MASHGYSVAIYNRSPDKTDEVMTQHPDSRLVPFHDIEGFVAALEIPRRVLLMVQAGEATDKMIDALKPHLQPGDIVIDAGNTHYQDTRRRADELKALGLEFIGTGVSGGEEGALRVQRHDVGVDDEARRRSPALAPRHRCAPGGSAPLVLV